MNISTNSFYQVMTGLLLYIPRAGEHRWEFRNVYILLTLDLKGLDLPGLDLPGLDLLDIILSFNTPNLLLPCKQMKIKFRFIGHFDLQCNLSFRERPDEMRVYYDTKCNNSTQ